MIPYTLKGPLRLGPFRTGAGHRGQNTGYPTLFSLRELIPGWADTTVVCPHCRVDGDVVTVLDHLLGEHDSRIDGAAGWLETIDCDLFALAVHSMMHRSQLLDA